MASDKKKAERAGELLRVVGRYATHLEGCAHWTEQTAEYCTCGYGDAAKAYQEALRLLGELGQ